MQYLKHSFALLILCFALVIPRAMAQPQLSASATISIYTCAPGDELYSVFGHTAIRIKDPQQALDQVYNYGIFDFDTPNFYVKFVRGQLPYRLGASKPSSFLREYNHFKRGVTENILLLEPAEKQAVAAFLFNNYKPEIVIILTTFFMTIVPAELSM